MNQSSDFLHGSKVLVIDDEPQIRKLLRLSLEQFEVKFLEAKSGTEGITFSQMYLPDLIILDMNLGDLSGVEVLKEIRKIISDKPILILTVENNSDLIVNCLHLGADDFITKPFHTGELIARMNVSMRRFKKNEIEHPIFKCHDLEVDFERRHVFLKGEEIKMTAIEFDLLKFFVKNKGKVLTHRQILKEIWGPSHVEHGQYIRVYVRHLRKKIETDLNGTKYLKTEPGVGYRFICH